MMKKIISLVLALSFIFALTGCAKKNMGRIVYNYKMDKLVELADYKGIKIDTSSKEFKEFFDKIIQGDIESFGFYEKITEGKVKKGDVVNIDFTGKIDGKEFEGGSSKGYSLEIGSGSFISGFEDKLIGVKIGSTVDLDLTFPDNYTEELAGKDVVFTVKVNYVETDEQRKPEDFYDELETEYKSVDEYYDAVTKVAAKNYIITKVVDNSEIKKYPKVEKKDFTEQRMSQLEKQVSSYGMSLDAYLAQQGMIREDFEKETVTNYIEPMMKEQMIMYAIFDKEGMQIDQKELERKTKENVASYNDKTITEQVIKEYSGEYIFEYMYISEKVVDFLYNSAKIS